jgi:hypothetical protein
MTRDEHISEAGLQDMHLEQQVLLLLPRQCLTQVS